MAKGRGRLAWFLPLLAAGLIVVLWLRQLLLQTGLLRESSLSLLANDLAAAAGPPLLRALAPSLLALLLVLLLPLLPARTWSRGALLLLLAAAVGRYLHWRVTVIPRGNGWLAGSGWLVLLLEALALVSLLLPLLPGLRFDPGRRSREADQQQARAAGASLGVAVWVQAGWEPLRLVRRALLASANLGPSLRSITLIDLHGRPELAALAASLAVGYVSPDAAASAATSANQDLLQRAFAAGDGELIAMVDADMVPLGDFLTRTRGFFEDPMVALVQTPDSYFGSEFWSRNLGVDLIIPRDREFSDHYLEVLRDQHAQLIGSGRACLLRRQALASLVDFSLNSPLERRRLGTRLRDAGWRLVYLDETLSLAEAPRRFARYLQQRLTAMAAEAASLLDPTARRVTAPGPGAWILGLHQLLLLAMPLVRAALVGLPLLALALGVPLIEAPLGECVAQGLPPLLLLLVLPAWISQGRQGLLWSAVIEALVAAPLIQRLAGAAMARSRPAAALPAAAPPPRRSPLKASARQSLSLALCWPFLTLEALLVAVLLLRYGLPMLPPLFPEQVLRGQPGYLGEGALLLWNLANGLLLLICLLCSIDQPVLRQGDRVPLTLSARLRLEGRLLPGITRDISETGVALSLDARARPSAGASGDLQLQGQEQSWPVSVVRGIDDRGRSLVGLRFEGLNPGDEARLLALLYRGGLGRPAAPSVRPREAALALLRGLRQANPELR